MEQSSLKATTGQMPRLSRRQLLQSGLASGAALLLSSSESSAQKSVGNGRKVVVVGAGFAGLACAHELSSAGFEVMVFDARKRVGGKVRSITNLLPGKVVEAGGEFLGANHPTALAYIAKFGLKLNDALDYEEHEPIQLNGRVLSSQEIEGAEEECERACAALTDAARTVVAEKPWESPNAETLDHTSTAAWLAEQTLSPLGRRLFEARLTIDNGVALERQSLLGNLAQIRGGGLEQYWTDTEMYRCRGGNQQLASKLAERIGADRIFLDTPIVRIEVSDQLVHVIDGRGKRHEADHVVMTAPPSVWGEIDFVPQLPKTLRPQMGSVVKFLTRVGSRFWERNDFAPTALSDGDTGSLWLGTENQSTSDAREVLVGFIGGPLASAWSSRAADEREPSYVKQLDSLQPGFAEANEVTQFVDWVGSPWSKAGYSFPAPGQIISQGKTLYEGLGRLHFAGEYTCYQFIGYMEGALNSGAGVARRLAQSNL